jgi:uncharacterized delta-60 repeat protein
MARVEANPTGRGRALLLLALFGLGLACLAMPAAAENGVATEWVKRYNLQANVNDRPIAIGSDGDGNIFVTGSASGEGSYDCLTIKYSPSGRHLWARRYKNGDAVAMAVDGQGNVLVTLNSGRTGTSWDIATIKYSPDGKRLWVRRYNGPGNGTDYASAMTVDGQGNVYVSGSSWGGDTGNNFAIIKYSPNGQRLWVRRPQENARFLAVDSQGNVYVTGVEGDIPTPNSVTVKYSPNGQRLWVRRYYSPKGFYSPRSLALDGQGNLYVNGLEGIYMTAAFSGTIKYSPDGEQLWEQCTVFGCEPQAMTVDSQDCVHVIGYNQLFKYNPDGELLRLNNFSGLFLNALTLDAKDNAYVTGASWSPESGYDYATFKYSPEGAELWARRYNGPGNGNDIAEAVAVDALGNVYVTGVSEGAATQYDWVTIRYLQSPRMGP